MILLKKLQGVIKEQTAALKNLMAVYAAALVTVLFIALQTWVPIGELTRDTLAVVNGKFYYGILSNIGLLIWCATVAICLFTSYLLKMKQEKLNGRFLFYSGMLTLFLLLDDMFLLHEQVFPVYLGVKEKLVLAVYPISVAFLLLKFRTQIQKTSYLILIFSLGFLALSMLVDFIFPKMIGVQLVFEDGFKFFGIVGWFSYFTTSCLSVLFTTSKSITETVEFQPASLVDSHPADLRSA